MIKIIKEGSNDQCSIGICRFCRTEIMATEEDVLLDTILCPQCKLTEIEMTRLFINDPTEQYFEDDGENIESSGGYEFSSRGIFSNVTFKMPNFHDLNKMGNNVTIKKYR